MKKACRVLLILSIVISIVSLATFFAYAILYQRIGLYNPELVEDIKIGWLWIFGAVMIPVLIFVIKSKKNFENAFNKKELLTTIIILFVLCAISGTISIVCLANSLINLIYPLPILLLVSSILMIIMKDENLY